MANIISGSGRAAAALLAGTLALIACRPAQTPADNNGATANAAANTSRPLLPTPEAPLNREALLLAVVQARSAAAAGADDREAQAALDGDRFEFRMRIGCNIVPAAQAVEGSRAVYDPETRRVELEIRQNLSLSDPAVAAAAGGRFEAAEGFWIPQPWLLRSVCPANAPVPAPVAPEDAEETEPKGPAEKDETAPEDGEEAARAAAALTPSLPPRTVGIAQFFTAEDSRLQRRDGRPYAARETLPEGAAGPQPGSWELVVSGRLRALDGRVVHCRPARGYAMPSCIVSAEFEQVAIVNAATGAELARWRRG